MRRTAFLFLLAACPGGGSHPKTLPKASPPDAAPVVETPDPVEPRPMALADSGVVPEWLDRGADPCQDFFRYACGGFLDSTTIPPDRSSWSAIQTVVQRNEEFLHAVLEDAAADPKGDPVLQKIGDYYASCLDEAAIDARGDEPLAALLGAIDGIKKAADVPRVVTRLHQDAIFPFFGLGPIQDFSDATQVILMLDQSGLGLPDRDYYVKNAGNMKDVRAKYTAHVQRMFVLHGDSEKQAKAAAKNVMRIETALAKMQQEEVFRRDPHNIYHRVDRKGLAKGWPWKTYLEELGLGDVDAITVHDPKYYAGVVKLLKKEKPAAIRDYLTWTLLDATAEHLSKPFVDEAFEMEKALSGVKQLPPRWRRCVQRVDDNLGELLGQPYVAANFSAQAKDDAIAMTRAVFAAMDRQLDALPWMDAETREKAREKFATMAYLVGYPDQWREYPFEVSRTDYAANALAAARHELARQLGKIGKPVDRFDWGMTPPTVNAYYDPTLNEIALPAGQLQPPFFGATFHPAVNFGSTGGGTIGHEMTHGFDDEGSQFDASGNLVDWWSESTKQSFAEATECVVAQYEQYEAVPGVHLNGKLTAGENIADIGGVKLAYQAYQQWRSEQSPPPPSDIEGFTDDQLYFLGYAQSWCSKMTPEAAEMRAHTDPHSPAKWRVNGVIVDQPGFGPAFSCAAGTPMNPGNACAVW